MTLADINSPAAMLVALEEFDRLGHLAFFEKYGF